MTEQETKTRLIEATQQLLASGADPDKITVRQIADQAGVGLGLINYHFGSRDNLLFEAVAVDMEQVVAEVTAASQANDASPEDRLRELLLQVSEIGMQHPKLTRIGVQHDLLQGGLGVPQTILPILRKVLPPNVDEQTLRLIAFQLIVSMQVAFIKMDDLRLYLGVDFNDPLARAQLINQLIDNLLKNTRSKR